MKLSETKTPNNDKYAEWMEQNDDDQKRCKSKKKSEDDYEFF